MPNDPENIIMKERFKKGIPLTYETFNDLSILSNEYSVKLKLLND